MRVSARTCAEVVLVLSVTAMVLASVLVVMEVVLESVFTGQVGPILSMKEIAEEPSLRETGTIVEVDHPERGKYLTVGCPIKLSDSPVDVERSPLLGEHTDEVLTDFLGYSAQEVEKIKASGAV